ncbi:MAG: alkene reductase [Alphaproteobacteria bacterium]|nr:alkene reductase [Alphaproteobacteria bacterium]
MTDLFDPWAYKGVRLQNRIAFSPVTRSRADAEGNAGPLQATYYAQRASAGLIFTEATAVTPGGRGGPNIPGLWDDRHIAAWKLVTDAVHAKGGVIFSQLWHAGRLSHSSLAANGEAPLAPSAMTQPGQIFTTEGLKPYEEAKAMSLEEIAAMVKTFRKAAERAKAAGFDGVELHGAHSYLVDAFVRDMTNTRTDRYGGSIENRARFMMEIMAELVDVWGPERVAIRLCPIGHAYQAWDSNPEPLFTHIVERLNEMDIGWLDLVEGDTGTARDAEPSFDLGKLRRLFRNVVIVNNLYTRELALTTRAAGEADMICFGRAFIGNPDLVERLKRDAPIVEANPRSYYGGGARGYTDWATLDEAAA